MKPSRGTSIYPDFTHEETEALRNQVPCAQSHFQESNPGLLSLPPELSGSARVGRREEVVVGGVGLAKGQHSPRGMRPHTNLAHSLWKDVSGGTGAGGEGAKPLKGNGWLSVTPSSCAFVSALVRTEERRVGPAQCRLPGAPRRGPHGIRDFLPNAGPGELLVNVKRVFYILLTEEELKANTKNYSMSSQTLYISR